MKKFLAYTVTFGMCFLLVNFLQYSVGWVTSINLSGIAVSAIIGGVAGPYLLEKK